MDDATKRTILIVGSGGREHALAWKLAQSAQVGQIWVAPGNGGTAGVGVIQNVALDAADGPALLAFAQNYAVDLTVVGPEAPLAAGIVDLFQAAGLRIFGPTQAAAQLESSKAFAKDFMWETGIPTAGYAIFDDYEAALEYVRQAERPLVVKASGLAAGKGVIVCDDMLHAEQAVFDMLRARVFGEAGDLIVIEERLVGPEVSLLAFCDGTTVAPMLPAQDHKRVADGDRGPNTGGMGAFAPAPRLTAALVDQTVRTVLQPALDGLAAQGTPFVGVLYAGLMLTPAGLRVLEFNVRFGDPETQVILPLLANDLLDVFDACLDGRLAACKLRWKAGAAVTVVAAAAGYPGAYPQGDPITGVEAANALPGVQVFQAGARREGERLLTHGGRVLAVTGAGADFDEARRRAYGGMEQIHFEGMHFRRDIGS
ncbi:MAG: phosphoribosylamine--glycine ligase [Anaerolineae bacterium]